MQLWLAYSSRDELLSLSEDGQSRRCARAADKEVSGEHLEVAIPINVAVRGHVDGDEKFGARSVAAGRAEPKAESRGDAGLVGDVKMLDDIVNQSRTLIVDVGRESGA